MNTTKDTTFWNSRVLTWLLIFAVLGYTVICSTRIIGMLGLLIGWLVALRYPQHRRRCLHVGCAVFLAAQLLPIDISFHCSPGPPHFVRYLSGLPSKAGMEAHQRGEVYLTYSCFRSPNEPRYVLVW